MVDDKLYKECSQVCSEAWYIPEIWFWVFWILMEKTVEGPRPQRTGIPSAIDLWARDKAAQVLWKTMIAKITGQLVLAPGAWFLELRHKDALNRTKMGMCCPHLLSQLDVRRVHADLLEYIYVIKPLNLYQFLCVTVCCPPWGCLWMVLVFLNGQPGKCPFPDPVTTYL